MPRNPKTGDLMTKEELREINKKRFAEALESGSLYNTGPITEEGGTSFSPERWDEYFKKNPEEAPQGWTNQKDYQEKLETGEIDTTVESLADMDKMEVYDEDDNLIYADGKEITQDRGLGGDRDAEGNFKTYMRPIDIKDSEVTVKDEQVPTEDVLADIESRRTPEALAAAEDRKKDREKRMADVNAIDVDSEVAVEMAEEDMAKEIEKEDSFENWLDNFNSMSDEMFGSINPEDLTEYGENAVAAYNQIKGMAQGLDEEVGGMLTKGVDSDSKTDMMKSAMINAGLNEDQSASLLDKLKGICN